ncbi:MAG: LamG-like jellyroll fold domain-containing protein [Nannocystaceae bacterium]
MSKAPATLKNMNADVWVSGRQFTALDFDGTDDYLETAMDLSVALGNAASLSFWVKTTQQGGASAADSPGVTGTTDGVQWGWLDAEGHVGLSWAGDSTVQSTQAINDGRWRHVVLIRDTMAGASHVYVDGILSASMNGAVSASSVAFSSLGRLEGSSKPYLQGRLDQIHAYNVVIDEVTVLQLYQNHAPKVWDTVTSGSNAEPFSTASMLFKSYDPEQDPLTVARVFSPQHGEVTDSGDGTFVYQADAGFTGTDSFDVVIADGRGGLSSGTLQVNVFSAGDVSGDNVTVTFDSFQEVQAGGGAFALSDGLSVPRAVDWEGDGDLDLLVGNGGSVLLAINEGTKSAPAFANTAKVQAAGSDIAGGPIALLDMTGDGNPDLVVAEGSTLKVYENTEPVGEAPVYKAPVAVLSTTDGEFPLPDPRFDLGDWNGDGLPDLVTGMREGEMLLFLNQGTVAAPSYDPMSGSPLREGLYNLYPRLFDINGSGRIDLVNGVNLGKLSYALDPTGEDLVGLQQGVLTVSQQDGTPIDMHGIFDGAIVDFVDFNDDQVLDLLLGGHGAPSLYIAYGLLRDTAAILSDLEAIYDAHPVDLGTALDADTQALLEEVKTLESELISRMVLSSRKTRESLFEQMAAHVKKYSFLQMSETLDTGKYHHVPSIAGQNLITMHQILPDSPTQRQRVADAVGLVGLHREIYLQSGLHVGDNQKAPRGLLESIQEFMTSEPREIFPDTVMTFDRYYGDDRGGFVDSFTGSKNTFGNDAGQDVSEWDEDLQSPVNDVFGEGAHMGDYTTFVMGHEETHSLDGYVRSRGNKSLNRRWGQSLVQAGGADIKASSNGWYSKSDTQAHFETRGLWDGVEANWTRAWDDYWETGPGSAWEGQATMRLGIKFFLAAPQESLATQANHHFAHSEGRLVAAMDRWERGVAGSLDPLKANLTEAVNFIDFKSAGMNKIVMYDTHGEQDPYPHASYARTHAWLERNDQGFITRIQVEDRSYDFELNAEGTVVGYSTSVTWTGKP